jgi:hypothetical protein
MSCGVLCIAQNNQDVDYVQLAYLQRLSLLVTNPTLPYALVTDQASADSITVQQRQAFDHVIVLQHDNAVDQVWKQRNEYQLFAYSPFRETIKVEADVLFTRNINHWWPALRKRDVVISWGCVDHKSRTASSRAYRKLFDLNNLPDVYSGLMYWRRSHLAHAFFETVQQIHLEWPMVQKNLVACVDPGSNDMVFALAVQLFGQENCTLPALDFFRMAHLKPAHVGSGAVPWHQAYHVEVVPPQIRVNGHAQQHPVHYHEKNWCTENLINLYRSCLPN